MKMDVLIVPNDTLVLGRGPRAATRQATRVDGRFPSDAFLMMLRAAYESCGAKAPASMKVLTQFAAMGVDDRLEPLYPVPDDLVVEPGKKDAVWVQPAYLEAVSSDAVLHDQGQLRLLVPSSRNMDARPFDAFLTRKGVRVWAERKAQRLTEGEHYMPFSRVFEVETRVEDGEQVLHMSLKSGMGLLVSVELPESVALLAFPLTVAGSSAGRAVRLLGAQFPLPSLDTKPRKRWRVCLMAHDHDTSDGWPSWVDPETLTTRQPLPEGGKVVAIARRLGESDVGAPWLGASGPAHAVTPVGTTLFIEYEEPVQIEQTAQILAGGN